MNKSRRKFIRNLLTASAGISLLNYPEELLAKEDLLQLTIFHTNDIHCHIDPLSEDHSFYKGRGGMASLSGLIKKLREQNPNSLLLDAGDFYQGTPYFNYYKGELIVKVMSKIGYDASTIGNHEFDNGLEGMYEPLYNSNFPYVCSNYDFTNTMLYGRFPDYVIYRRGGVKVGLYGLGIELNGLVSPKNYLETVYNDPVEVALEKENFLRNEKKCDLVICLSHLGLEYKNSKISDKKLAALTRHTDLIIGGHTHTFLDKPLELKNANGERIIVNQAGWGGMVLGKIDFLFGRNKKEKPVVIAQNMSTS
ncbi:bifunctional metallophosphatase/5'-nucleotidase [Sunxiuqinia sp. A32]